MPALKLVDQFLKPPHQEIFDILGLYPHFQPDTGLPSGAEPIQSIKARAAVANNPSRDRARMRIPTSAAWSKNS